MDIHLCQWRLINSIHFKSYIFPPRNTAWLQHGKEHASPFLRSPPATVWAPVDSIWAAPTSGDRAPACVPPLPSAKQQHVHEQHRSCAVDGTGLWRWDHHYQGRSTCNVHQNVLNDNYRHYRRTSSFILSWKLFLMWFLRLHWILSVSITVLFHINLILIWISIRI